VNNQLTAETAVRDAWNATLRVESIAPQDTFFGLGGDSLSAIEVMESVETALGIEFPLDVLFGEGTFAAVVHECASRFARTSGSETHGSRA
jgi:acyl carrier protein